MDKKSGKRISAFQMQSAEEQHTESHGDKKKKHKNKEKNRYRASSETDGATAGQIQSDGPKTLKKRRSSTSHCEGNTNIVKEKQNPGLKKRKVHRKMYGPGMENQADIETNQRSECAAGACEIVDLVETDDDKDNLEYTKFGSLKIHTVGIEQLTVSDKQCKGKKKKKKKAFNSPDANCKESQLNDITKIVKPDKHVRNSERETVNDSPGKYVKLRKKVSVDKNEKPETLGESEYVDECSAQSTASIGALTANDEFVNDGLPRLEKQSFDCPVRPDSSDREAAGAWDKELLSSAKHDGCVALNADNGVVVILGHPVEYVLKGKARVQCLAGSLTIFGHHLEAGSSPIDVFSPDCNSLLTLTTRTGDTNVSSAITKVSKCLLKGFSKQDLKLILHDMKSFVVVNFSNLDTPFCDYIANIVPYTSLFKTQSGGGMVNEMLEGRVDVSLHLPDGSDHPYVQVSSQLQEALDTWLSAIGKKDGDGEVVMVCGGKDSGKSTTNRILINSTLNRLSCVYYLECDVGQTEFTPPGIVSLLKVTTPVVGPPFCHQRVPVCSYLFGGLSPTEDPNGYIRFVHLCVQQYRQLNTSTPLIVNTMGWMKGLGLKLLVDTVRLVAPSHIIQLQSRQRSQRADPLTEEFYLQTSWTDVSRSDMMQHGDFSIHRKRRTPHIVLVAATAPTGIPKLRPVEHRDLSVLSHMSADLEPGLTLTSLIPYCIPWHCVAVYAPQVAMTHLWYAINGSLVALCSADLSQAELVTDDGPLVFRQLPVCQWIGYGIVRGIDLDRRMIVVTTTLGLDSLSYVNTLVKGAVTLPQHILLDQAEGDQPYVSDAVSAYGSAAIRPRKRIPRSHQSNTA